ncbi:HTH domain-containing protein [Thermodesulfatator atlanticus]|uniref:HTH domain-containing protein n=1 Tax=Thermodesulfatator atlanticus TaxID=501497 RepID=UPI0003B67F7D|nr:helix-turn-helix domain-containing protein [Thermodesulfatator atlanticus]
MARKRSRPVTKEDVKFVYENYLNMSAAEIAEKLGISKFQVMKIVTELRKRGVPIPKKVGKRENPIDAFVKELKEQGKL